MKVARGDDWMYRLLIIDDEAIVRKGLAKIVELSESGFEVAGEAENGWDGLKLATEIKPELIIVDVKMPGMTGLDMIENLVKMQIQGKFIILSAYTDYDFIHRAIQNGVVDYLMKPVNRLELMALLQKVKGQIDLERQEAEKNLQMTELSEALPVLKERFLKDFITQDNVSMEQLQKLLKVYQIHWQFQRDFAGMVIRLDDFSNFQPTREEIAEPKGELVKRIQACLTIGNHEFFYIGENKLAGLLSFPGEFDWGQLREKICQFNSKTDPIFESGVTIGVGPLQNTLMNLKRSFGESLQALQTGFYLGKGKVYFVEDIVPFETVDYLLLFEKERQVVDGLVVDLMAVNQPKAVSKAENLWEPFQERYIHPDLVVKYISHIVEYIQWNLKRNGYSACENLTEFEKTAALADTLSDLKKSFEDFIADQIEMIQNLQSQGNRKVTAIAKEYILANYQKDLSLEAVAQVVNMNTNYFSSLFKKEIGENFIDFVTRVRIEKAKELLNQIDLKIYDVSRMVGYYSPKHFSKIFREIVGMTPLEYRNKLR